jgi:hypothetical protein
MLLRGLEKQMFEHYCNENNIVVSFLEAGSTDEAFEQTLEDLPMWFVLNFIERSKHKTNKVYVDKWDLYTAWERYQAGASYEDLLGIDF